ncbi:MAG TPA: sigma-70 family RNA polymerase sigma factor [Vicinamibacterales bacterium]|nr:sigma-70 family RNA polymerase sigma factor [Vicinamibacterales bacterium]
MATGDDDLVARIRAGDEDAASLFDERFRARIERIARHRGVPSADCPDIAQLVLTDAIRQIQGGLFRGAASLTTWLYPIISGKIADYRRRQPRAELVPLESLASDNAALLTKPSSDDVVWVRQALARLSAEEQLLLFLHDRQRHTLQEIGRLLRLKKSAVGERLAHAREHFRQALRDGGNPPPSKRLKD